MFHNRREDLQRNDIVIGNLERELAEARFTSRRVKLQHAQSTRELSRITSTGASFIQVIDSLGANLQDAILAAVRRLDKNS